MTSSTESPSIVDNKIGYKLKGEKLLPILHHEFVSIQHKTSQQQRVKYNKVDDLLYTRVDASALATVRGYVCSCMCLFVVACVCL